MSSATLLRLTAFAGLVAFATATSARADEAETLGPAKGTLFIGGGQLSVDVLREFVQLAVDATPGGNHSPIIVIPTAKEGDRFDDSWSGLEPLRAAGAKHLHVLHTRDRDVAGSEEFVAPLLKARAVWLGGGRQWRLVDAYAGTRTEAELHKLLERGGVIGGSSAGASIQASFLVRGDPRGNSIVIARGYTKGFGFLRHSAIDQHWLKRMREDDLARVIERHPKLTGIGIDENTAVIVHRNRLKVVGNSRVAIYRADAESGERPYRLLSPGDVYDLGR
jgi:cyanophycinase